jgi:hypothetical protein
MLFLPVGVDITIFLVTNYKPVLDEFLLDEGNVRANIKIRVCLNAHSYFSSGKYPV